VSGTPTKTPYRLAFDNAALIADATAQLKESPAIARAQILWDRAQMAGDRRSGSWGRGNDVWLQNPASENAAVRDVLGELQNRTQLTRKTLAEVLIGSGRLDDLRQDPDQATAVINKAKIAALVVGVRYQKIGPDSYYAQELSCYLGKMVDVQKAPTQSIRVDIGSEGTFATALNANEAVKVFANLPGWFKIPMPLGTYNPDWAVLVTTETGDRLYFVVERKGSSLLADLRPDEAAKVRCGEAHFLAIVDAAGAPRIVQEVTAEGFISRVS
jgi:type III restriction enzyme